MTRPTVRQLAFACICSLAVPLAAVAQDGYSGPGVPRNMLRFSLGYFTPQGDSIYWQDKELEFTGRADDFEDVSVGFDYLRQINEYVSLVGSSTFYEGNADQAYLDFVDTANLPIRHTTTLTLVSFNIGVQVNLAPRRSPVIPYLAAGGGLYLWELGESGEFIDFSSEDLEIFDDSFKADGDTFGWYWLAGLSVPLGNTWSVFGEGRWQIADDELGGDFTGFGNLDMSGREFRLGFAWRF
jgi:opacity protein-like surface antigen